MSHDALDHLETPEPIVGDPRLANPFEDFEEAYPMAPCRTIEVTPELQEQDRLQREAREASCRANVTWTPPKPVAAPPRPVLLTQPTAQQRQRAGSAGRKAKREAPSPAQPSPAQPSQRKTSRRRVSSGSSSGGGEGDRDERTWFEEHELDQLWRSLSVNDKWTILQEALDR